MSTRYVWGRYSIEQETRLVTRYRQTSTPMDGSVTVNNVEPGDSFQVGASYSFSEYTGTYSLRNLSTYTLPSGYVYDLARGYMTMTSGYMYYGEFRSVYGSLHIVAKGSVTGIKYGAESYQTTIIVDNAGTFLASVSSASSGAYPYDDSQGGYYYKLQGSDNIDPAAVALPAEVYEGKAAVITLTPGTGKVYDGTVSYTCQYRLDGGAWQDLGTTGAVSYSFQVPEGAATIQVRARAQDDLGFVSADWVTSAAAEVTGNRPPSITSSSGPSGVDLGTRISAFAVQYTLADPDGDLLTVTEALDGEEQRSFPAALGTVYSVQITQNFFGTIPAGAHTLTITASDGDAETTWTATFTKEGSGGGGGPTPGPDDPDTPEVSNTTSEILIELTEPGAPLPVVHVGWGDQYSRKIQLRLYENGLPYTPPAGTTCAVAWKGSQPAGLGRTGDIYNTIQEADGTTRSACTIEGSTLTVELSDQLCRAGKEVQLSVLLIGPDGSVANVWPIRCRLHPGVCNDDIRMAADHLEHIQVNDRGIALSTQ